MKLCMGCMSQIEDHLSTCPYCGFNEMTMRQESYYLDPGTIVGGKYIVGRVLNYGGHTVSYLGMDAEKERKVIVKEYLPSDFSTRSEGEKDVTIYSGDGQAQFEQGLTNFLNEANRIQGLGAVKGIAQVYDCLAENETGYVISEYVEGRTLKEILDGGKRYSAEEAAAFIRRILQGLAGVHRMDIVHCDISPETIMVANDGEIKLTDFGATRYVTTANSKSLSIILKRGYAPEEQYRSKGRRGPWTDVYALGAVMYRMMTGVVPQESVERALSDDLREPSRLGVSIPQNMENALMNALNVYQEDRTQSAEDFLRELNSEDVRRVKVKQKKNKTGKFPLWAKCLVAGLACVVLAGSGFVVRGVLKGSSGNLGSTDITMPDLTGETLEKAREEVKALNEDWNWNIEVLEKDFVFDLLQDNGIVCSQSVTPGTVLSRRTQDEENASEEMREDGNVPKETQDTEIAPDGLYYGEDGTVSGTIYVSLYSNEKIHYSDLSGQNAYELAQKLKVDPGDKDRFVVEENENDGKNYFDLAKIEMNGETISAADLEKKDNQDKEIAYDSDVKIYYYASEFFYWKKLPDFAEEYGNINDVPEQEVSKYINENERQPVGKKSLTDGGLIDDSYCAFASDGYEEGQIVGQTVAAGEKYDGSNPGDTLLEIQVVDTVLDHAGKTGSEFISELKEKGFGYYMTIRTNGNGGNPDWRISDVVAVKAWKDEDGNLQHDDNQTLEAFRPDTPEGPSVCFIIYVKEPETEPPQLPTYNGGENTGGGSTGGGKTSERGWDSNSY